MNYKKMEVWQLAREIVIEIHKMSLTLPKFEMFEEGQQIMEGYGRRRYKNDFIKFLVYAHASNDGTIDPLKTLFETKSLTDEELYNDLKKKLDLLGRKPNHFIQSVESNHISEK